MLALTKEKKHTHTEKHTKKIKTLQKNKKKEMSDKKIHTTSMVQANTNSLAAV